MDLKNYQLVRETPDEFHIRDARDGKQFSVAKRAIGGATVQQIKQHFAEGGTVMPDDGSSDDPILSAVEGIPTATVDLDGDGKPDDLLAMNLKDIVHRGADWVNEKMGKGGVPDEGGSGPIGESVARQGADFAPDPASAPVGESIARQASNMNFAPDETGMAPPAPQQRMPSDLGGMPGSDVEPNLQYADGRMMQPSHQTAPDGDVVQMFRQAMSKPPAGASAPGQGGPGGPGGGTGGSGSYSTPPTDDEITSNYGMAESARLEQAKAQQDLAQNLMELNDTKVKRLQEIADANAQQYKAWQDRGDQLFQAYMNMKIDPNRVWKNAGTGRQIGAAIAMAIGGLAQGMARKGGPNVALDIINKAIDRDIDSQKTDLHKAEFGLHWHLRQGENMIQAQRLAKADYLEIAAAQAQSAVLRFTGPLAKAQGDEAVAALREQARVARETAAMHSLKMAADAETLKFTRVQHALMIDSANRQQMALAGKGPMEGLPDEMRKRAAYDTQGKTVLFGSDKDAEDYKTRLEGFQEIVGHAQDLARARFGTKWNGEVDKDGNPVRQDDAPGRQFNPWSAQSQSNASMKTLIAGSLRKAVVGGGHSSDQQLKRIDSVVPDPGAMMSDKAFLAKLNAMVEAARQGVESSLKSRRSN